LPLSLTKSSQPHGCVQALPVLPNFNLRNFRLKQLLKKVKNENNDIFKTCAKFFLSGVKAQWVEGGRRIRLGDNASGGAVMLGPILFQGVGVWM
jgi:hypothetical protein